MKLKNKKTGEIGYLIVGRGSYHYVVANNEWSSCGKYTSLAELNAEWQDYEEPKTFWAISWAGEPEEYDAKNTPEELKNMAKQIGNYFDTREEAEKAVKKLKAWHKLMDYWGTEVLGWEIKDMPTGGNWQTVNVKFNVKTRKEPMELLDIVFGGEE